MTDLATLSAAEVGTSNNVYVLSDDHAWVPARVIKSNETEATVSIPVYKEEQAIQSDGGKASKGTDRRNINLLDYPNKALPLQNVNDKGLLKEVEDMVDLPFLHEAAILYNLKARHLRALPYTRTGDIVIAVNPYQWLMGLYSDAVRNTYADTLVWDESADKGDARSTVEPHVYEASALAYRGLAVEGKDQSILVSGESGAGKTETVKILMSHLASIQAGVKAKPGGKSSAKKMTDFSTSPIVKRVLDSNPLLEAFGNAKTVRNDNSSRFGKYIQLQFDAEDPTLANFTGRRIPSCILAGSKCEVYLLEKSRVVGHEEEERTYHIFYQLLAAPEEKKMEIWEGLEDTDTESFSYVGWSDTEVIENKTDGERFQLTIDALALVGISDDKLRTLMRAICIVMQLGNLTFEPDEKDEEHSDITSIEELEGLADLMGMEQEEVKKRLTLRTVKARNEEYKVPLKAVQAKDSCDAFAKEIYAKTFLWLVRNINGATCAENNYDGKKSDGFALIGLLDIFGFESFETNRFEQLCINYANEKLQQKFTQDIFRSVQAEYEYEGIALEEITYEDNVDVLDLIEGRMGLIAVLNDECVRPKGSDTAFVGKIQAVNKDTDVLICEKSFMDYEFGVKHYAGPVIYDATSFVTKNMDHLPGDLLECAEMCTNEILSQEMHHTDSHAPKAAKKKRRPAPTKVVQRKQSLLIQETVWTKFKNQLNSLMANLGMTRTRYIRCIKPNVFKKPRIMQHLSTVEQLRCAGVVAAVTISRSAFPNRLEHEIVLDRFRSLWTKGNMSVAMGAEDSSSDEESKNQCRALLTQALKSLEVEKNGKKVQAFVIGNTRAYFRAGALEFLESQRLNGLSNWAIEIQRVARGFLVHSQYRKLREATIVAESVVRAFIAKQRYRRLRMAAIAVQCWTRCVAAAAELFRRRMFYKATLIQTHWRMAVAITAFKRHRNAAIKIQAVTRGAIQRPIYRKDLQERREEAKLENKLLSLQKKLDEAEARRVEAEKKAKEKPKIVYRESEEKKTEAAPVAKKKPASPRAKKKPAASKTPKLASPKASKPAASKTPKPAAPKAPEPAAPKAPEPAAPVAPAVAAVAPAVVAAAAVTPQLVEETKVEPPAPAPAPPIGQLTEQQQNLMDESGKMLEYLRKEVFKLRSQNSQLRADFDLLKENNQRLMDANASAGASFAALNQHAKQLNKTNAKLVAEITSYKMQVHKVNLVQVELRDELKMKQAAYVAEVHSRLQYQKTLGRIVDTIQERCRDTSLVENILAMSDECEGDYMNATTQKHYDTAEISKQEAARPHSGRSIGGKLKKMFH